jgi:hypothetical protein
MIEWTSFQRTPGHSVILVLTKGSQEVFRSLTGYVILRSKKQEVLNGDDTAKRLPYCEEARGNHQSI